MSVEPDSAKKNLSRSMKRKIKKFEMSKARILDRGAKFEKEEKPLRGYVTKVLRDIKIGS